MQLADQLVSQQWEYSKKKMSPASCRVISEENLQHGERKNLKNQSQAAQRTFSNVFAMDVPNSRGENIGRSGEPKGELT